MIFERDKVYKPHRRPIILREARDRVRRAQKIGVLDAYEGKTDSCWLNYQRDLDAIVHAHLLEHGDGELPEVREVLCVRGL